MVALMALRRSTAAAAAAASTLFAKYLNPKVPSAMIAPLATRSFASTSTTKTSYTTAPPTDNASASAVVDVDHDVDEPPVIVQGSPQKFKMENPFQSDGPRNVIEVDDAKNGALVRLTLPGVGEDGFKVWAESNTVFFMGKGDIEFESEKSGRKYGGSLEFRPELHRADGVKAEMKNGILRLLIPNAEGVEKEKKGSGS